LQPDEHTESDQESHAVFMCSRWARSSLQSPSPVFARARRRS
jgi:hypothetical protein